MIRNARLPGVHRVESLKNVETRAFAGGTGRVLIFQFGLLLTEEIDTMKITVYAKVAMTMALLWAMSVVEVCPLSTPGKKVGDGKPAA